MRNTLLTAGCGALLAASLSAQSFTTVDLGFGSYGTGISHDGETVVGWDLEPWMWTPGSGVTVLTGGSFAWACSADGSVIAGEAPDATFVNGMATWDATNGWQATGGLPGSTGCPDYGRTTDISDDGSIMVGRAWEDCLGTRAFRWTAAGGIELMADLGPGNSSADAISGDGQVVGGWDENGFGTRRAALWSGGVKTLILVDSVNVDGEGEVRGLNSDGSVAVGFSNQFGAFVWRAGTGVEYLDAPAGLTPGLDTIQAFDCSEDGNIIVGTAGSFFSAAAYAWVYGSPVLLTDVAADQGLLVPGGFALQKANAITPDGMAIVGDGGSFFSAGAWIMHLGSPLGPWSDLGNGLAGTYGEPQMVGSGSLEGGSPVGLNVSGALENSSAYVLMAASTINAPFKGGVLVPSVAAPSLLLSLVTDAAGELDLDATWPAGIPSDVTVYLQAWIADPAGPVGFSATNAIAGTTP